MPNLSGEEASRRLHAVRQQMKKGRLDALLVVDAANIRYLTGFDGEGAQAFVTRRSAWLLAAHRAVERASKQTVAFDVIDHKERPRFLKKWAKGRKGRAIGVEGSISHGAFQGRRKGLRPARLKACDVVRQCRAVKSAGEVACLRKAQRAAEAIFEEFIGELRPGMTERQAHHRLLQLTYANARLDGPAFDPIVAAGPSAWAPHSRCTDRKFRRRDCTIIDMGVRYRGYCSDMTRTVFLGEPTRRMRHVYAAVLDAQQRAIDAIRAGALGKDIDAAARDAIRDRGLEPFPHGLGHGIGLEVHEPPGLGGKQPLREGVVVTVEPGVYLQRAFGVRIEDMVLVTADGCTNLTRAPKALTVIG
ncbi:M24 family metallopeptidase [Planctomycetota bacterium]